MTPTAPNEPVTTFDIDWAPDDQIDLVADRLRQRGVRSTWFVTHDSSAVDRLRREPELFELGMHPNFLEGSTHGGTPDEVIQHCCELVSDSTSTRSHGLVQSSHLLNQILRSFPQRAEASIYLGRAAYAPPIDYYWMDLHTVRTPTVWADDLETMRPDPLWDCDALRSVCRGLLILTFHPIHVIAEQQRPSRLRTVQEEAHGRRRDRGERARQARPAG